MEENVKKLYGAGASFPWAVRRVPDKPGPVSPSYLNAALMSIGTPGSGDADQGVVFGMNPAATAAFLRAIADDIEQGNLLLLQGAVTSRVRRDDYPATWVTIKVCEKQK